MRLTLVRFALFAMLALPLLAPLSSTPPTVSACVARALPCTMSEHGLNRGPRVTTPGTDVASAPVATFPELSLLGETAVTVPVTVSFTVNDSSGSTQGFVAALGTSGYGSSLLPSWFTIQPSQFAVAATPDVFAVCAPGSGGTAPGCGPGLGVASSGGQTLDTNPPVAVQCPTAATGAGAYDVRVPLTLTLTAQQVQLLGSLPIELTGGFSVTVTQPQDPSIYQAYGCPSSSTAARGSGTPRLALPALTESSSTIVNLSASVSQGAATYELCALAATPPTTGGVIISDSSGRQLHAALMANGQTCGAGTYALQATFSGLSAGHYEFQAACLLNQGSGTARACVDRATGLISNFQGASVANQCQVDFDSTAASALRDCAGPGVAGNLPALRAASIALSPASGVPFQTVTLTGSGFGAGEPIRIFWDSTSATPMITPTTQSSGDFTSTLTIPQAITGLHTLIAVGQTSALTASTAFQVKPAVYLFPASGRAGSVAYAIGVGFGRREPVVALWYPGFRLLSFGSSNALGTAVLPFRVPTSTPGSYDVIGYGLNSKGYAFSRFTVAVAAASTRPDGAHQPPIGPPPPPPYPIHLP